MWYRNLLDKHSFEIQQTVKRNSYVIGALLYDRSDLEKKKKARSERLSLKIIGLLSLDKDIPVDLADEVIESVQVRGVFNASEPVKAVLADRMK